MTKDFLDFEATSLREVITTSLVTSFENHTNRLGGVVMLLSS